MKLIFEKSVPGRHCSVLGACDVEYEQLPEKFAREKAPELPELSEVDNIKSALRSLGAEATLMSGSGPSVFGIFGTKTKAEEATNKLKENGIFAVYARTVRY